MPLASDRYCRVEGCAGGAGCVAKQAGRCRSEYVAADVPERLRWRGEGNPPAMWNVDGVVVYRSHEDYLELSN